MSPKMEPTSAWRQMASVTFKQFQARLWVEPRNLFLGVFWDYRPSGLNVWLCLLPIFTLQLVFRDEPSPLCSCGFQHGVTEPPPWCLEIRKLKAQKQALVEYVERPLIRKIFLDQYFREKKEAQDLQK